MLKGAIDHVSPNEVGGWIYSTNGSVRNHTVLAFIHDVCVGAGRVEVYREDLADAGLGDGFLGFRFPVSLAKLEDAPLVAVKLEGSDAVIIQPTARLAPRANYEPRAMVSARSLASIEWMRARGWLDQADYDFLRLMHRFGAYDLSLRKGKPVENPGVSGLRDPQEVAQQAFELLCASPTKVSSEVLTQETGLRPQIERFQAGSIEPIVAVWSPQSASLSLVEGSHLDAASAESEDAIIGAVDYGIGPDRLLFVDLRCRMTWKLAHQVRCYSIMSQ
jgi:hypothetical protein